MWGWAQFFTVKESSSLQEEQAWLPLPPVPRLVELFPLCRTEQKTSGQEEMKTPMFPFHGLWRGEGTLAGGAAPGKCHLPTPRP